MKDDQQGLFEYNASVVLLLEVQDEKMGLVFSYL